MNLNGKLKIQINIFYKYIIIYILFANDMGIIVYISKKNIDFYIFYKMKYNIYIYYIIYKIIRKKMIWDLCNCLGSKKMQNMSCQLIYTL
jgi:hypothetical protein